MIPFAQHIEESLNSSYPYKKNQWGASEALVQFIADDITTFGVVIHRTSTMMAKEIEVYFYQRLPDGHDTMYPTGNIKNALKVYATIGKVIKEYIDEYPVNNIKFVAASKRTREIYQQLSLRIAKNVGGVVIPTGHPASFQVYIAKD